MEQPENEALEIVENEVKEEVKVSEPSYLLYYSVLNFDSPGLDLFGIFQKSQKNNQRDGITGALIHQDGKFMGYLEGEKEILEATFRRISRDPRHQFLKILVSGKRKTRFFDGWRTFWKPLTDQDYKDLRAINNDPDFNPEAFISKAKNSIIGELMCSFYECSGLNFEKFWNG
jgi:hypothetical protein